MENFRKGHVHMLLKKRWGKSSFRPLLIRFWAFLFISLSYTILAELFIPYCGRLTCRKEYLKKIQCKQPSVLLYIKASTISHKPLQRTTVSTEAGSTVLTKRAKCVFLSGAGRKEMKNGKRLTMNKTERAFFRVREEGM